VQILKYPHPTLRHKSKPLRRVDPELRQIIRRMFEVMYEGKGIGLAANQVGLPYRMFVMNLRSDPEAVDEEHVFINPVIAKRSGSAEGEEGCLSFPGVYAPVRRSEKIVLSAYNPVGQEVTYELDGLYARAVQHETDHLDGVVFIDRLSSTAKLAVKEPLADLERQFEGDRRRGLLPDDEQILAQLAELEKLRT
jgi:peptide deformylase